MGTVDAIEFLLGKQLPYIGVAMANFAVMFLMALFVFEVPLKGSFLALLLGALLFDRIFELPNRHARLQSQSDLRPSLRMGYVPALGLTPRLPDLASLFVIGMNLHRELLMRKKKFQQQRKAPRVAGGVAHQLPLIFFTELCQRLSGERPVRDFAIVSREPGLADFLPELAIGVNRG